jgi:hypothetical protein
MPSIQATVNFSYTNLTTGRITATPTETFLDGTGKLVIGGIPFPSVNIASGLASIVLPTTKDYGIAYKFVIESGTNPTFTKVDEFFAILDNLTPINGNTLIAGFFSQDTLDTSLYSITDLLTKVPFLDRLAARIPGFVYKNWTTTQSFAKNEITFRGSRLYQWMKVTSGVNVDPLAAGNYHDPGNLLDGTNNVNASWLVVSGSLVGSGTTTTNIAYNAATFANLLTEPASRKNLSELDALLRLALTPDLTNYARLDEPNTFEDQQTFGVNPLVPDLPGSDNSFNAINSRTVRAIIAGSNISANLANRISIVDERYASGVSVSLNSGVNIRQINTIARQNANADIVDIVAAAVRVKAGTYLILATSTANRINGSRIYLYDEVAATNYSALSNSGFVSSSVNVNAEMKLIDILTFSSTALLTLRHVVETASSSGGGVSANRSGFQEIYSRIMFFRLA